MIRKTKNPIAYGLELDRCCICYELVEYYYTYNICGCHNYIHDDCYDYNNIKKCFMCGIKLVQVATNITQPYYLIPIIEARTKWLENMCNHMIIKLIKNPSPIMFLLYIFTGLIIFILIMVVLIIEMILYILFNYIF